MRVLLTGATGFVGAPLAAELRSAGHEVRTVSRGSQGDHDWSEESLSDGVSQSDAVVHLAGESLYASRWTSRQKELLRASRIESTGRLAELAVRHGCRAFLSASAIGYYGASNAPGIDEDSPPGDDFLARLCVDWERAADPCREAGIRTAALRLGVVIGPGGGALQQMLLPFKLGVGGRLGTGQQWFSWVHRTDVVGLIRLALEREELSGAINLTAPEPVRNLELTRALGSVLRRPTLLPVPAFGLRLMLGEFADVLLTGQHVLPRRAQAAGYKFAHFELESALRDALGR